MNNFSIITCTYNPNEIIFKRLIKAIENLIIPENSDIEWIIVDNNSTKPVSELEYINSIIKKNAYAKIIEEKNQGLTNARIAGVKASKYDWLIFFDDDNEPDKNYLQNLTSIIKKEPSVACWGPGIINVEFIGTVKNKWVETKKDRFQQKQIQETIIGNKKGWQDYYPVGTGLVATKEVLTNYVQKIENKTFTLTDRKGKSLISGGDTQIVLNAQKLGYYCGISPKLELNHLIIARKATKKYIFKQKYWTASSYLKCYNEVYSETPIKLEYKNSSQILSIIIKQFYHWKFIKKETFIETIFLITGKLGEINARFIAGNKKSSLILRLIENTILR